MTREQAKDHIKTLLSEYLSSKGINTNSPFNCLNPEHTDRNPSMSYNPKLYNVKCFGTCGKSYDIFDLIGLDHNLNNFNDQFNKACEMFNIDISQKNIKTTAQEDFTTEDKFMEDIKNQNIEKYIIDKSKSITISNYMQERGISLTTCNKFNIGYDYNCQIKGAKGWQAIIIPTGKYSCVIRDTSPEAIGNNRYRKLGNSQLFNKDVLNSTDKPIFIVEGEIDALSIIELGYNAMGLGSTANKNQFITLLKATTPKNLFILALDNDDAGKKATKDLIQEMEKLKINYSCPEEFYKNYHDANDFLLKDKEGFKSQLEKSIVETNPYQKNNALNQLQAFINGITESVDTPYISTGFKKLDKSLDGGLYEGLYCIGAISSLGKTTFILQIADQIAELENDVLIFSLEMSRFELMAKSISRETMKESILDKKYTYDMTKSARGITTGRKHKYYNDLEKELIKKSIINYSKYAKNIYIHEGIGDIGVKEIKEKIEQHITFTGKKPLVIIDYLQILAPTLERGTDKQNTDKAVLELKRIARDFKIPVFTISSFNRENYSAEVSMTAFKESGAIEYSSDVLIGLQLKYTVAAGLSTAEKEKAIKKAIEEVKTKDPREIELKILKNRNGKTGDKITYEYYPKTNFFEEKGD